jgi:hypothetical protein
MSVQFNNAQIIALAAEMRSNNEIFRRLFLGFSMFSHTQYVINLMYLGHTYHLYLVESDVDYFDVIDYCCVYENLTNFNESVETMYHS